MKKAHEWRHELRDIAIPDAIELVEGRNGFPTLRVGGAFLHSQYRPVEEAQRLIDSADLDPERPVLVIGLGLGYHVLTLIERNFDVTVIEHDLAIIKLALEGPLSHVDDLDIDTGTHEDITACKPQCLIHPASARAFPGFAAAIESGLAQSSLKGRRLPIAVVGPMYGGSLPIAQYLTRAFERLGHHARYIDNTPGWPMYEAATASVKSKKANAQLSEMMLNTMNEWTYARVAEFEPALCIVLAQAPVLPTFAQRLRDHGIASAFWFVENWRHMPYWESIAPEYDYFFHIQPESFPEKLNAIGCKHHAFIPTGCDPELHRPVTLNTVERAEFECEIGFAGAGYRNRNHLFAGLTDYDLKLWGVDWQASELQRYLQGGNKRFDNDDLIRIVAGSRINVNLHASAMHNGVDPGYDAVNPRVFEVAACGGFQLSDACQGLDQFFDPSTELPVYHDLQELRSQIDHYLAHPEERDAIASQARNRALRDHTYDIRAKAMLDAMLDTFGAQIAAAGTRAEHTVDNMQGRVTDNQPLSAFLNPIPNETPFTLEGLGPYIGRIGEPWGEAEGIFAYLREMRSYSETLLASHEG
jgi:spore maturation protein CgeB